MRDGHDICTRQAIDNRVTLHSSDFVLLEDYSAAAQQAPVAMLTDSYQVHFPYFGLFALSVGSTRWMLDPNTSLFVAPEIELRIDHPVPNLGHSALVVTPSRQVLEELCCRFGASWKSAFVHVSRASMLQLNLLVHELRRLHDEAGDPLLVDECVVHALRLAISQPPLPRSRSSRIVDRAKQVLHARSCERLTLNEIAREIGVTPVYLTQEFSRSEGVPLYRYQVRLRLNRALLELPHCDDITGLALDLGFSSHSHFSSVFRRAFGLTPSEYRSSVDLPPDRLSSRLSPWCVRFHPRRAA